LNVTVTVSFAVSVTEQGFVLAGVSQSNQFPNVDPEFGTASSVSAVPLKNSATHGAGLVQVKPAGELVTVPDPFPANVTVKAGPVPLPLLVKQVTLAVIELVTMAPDEDTPEPSLFVFTVAEIRVPPQTNPVAVISPVELTVTICGVFDDQVTWSVISLVTGGCR
jgi:hypothetical protein